MCVCEPQNHWPCLAGRLQNNLKPHGLLLLASLLVVAVGASGEQQQQQQQHEQCCSIVQQQQQRQVQCFVLLVDQSCLKLVKTLGQLSNLLRKSSLVAVVVVVVVVLNYRQISPANCPEPLIRWMVRSRELCVSLFEPAQNTNLPF